MPLRFQAWASGNSKADRHPSEFEKPGALRCVSCSQLLSPHHLGIFKASAVVSCSLQLWRQGPKSLGPRGCDRNKQFLGKYMSLLVGI